MKRILFIAALSFAVSASAQDDVLSTGDGGASNPSKNGKQLTPVAGDIGLSFNAAPFFQWGGDLFGFSGSNIALDNGVSTPDDFSIMVRYFLDDETAVRASVGAANNLAINKFPFNDDLNALDPNAYVMNRQVVGDSEYRLTVGIEKRRGEHRIQGYYGADFGMFRQSFKVFEEYGNMPTVDNQQPAGWNTFIASYEPTTFGFGLAGVIGAEYFFAPRMSLGAEFNLGLSYFTQTRGETQFHEWSDGGLETRIVPSARFKGVGLNTRVNSTVNLNLFF